MTAVRIGWALLAAASGLGPTRGTEAPAPLPRVLGLSHIAVKATDFEKSVSFYRDFLGFAEQGRLSYPSNGRRELAYVKVSDTQTIEVFDAANVTQAAGKIYQIALIVEDAEAMRAHLARRGCKVPPQVPRGQMKNANFTVRDPNGYIIELVQYLPEGRMVLDRGRFLAPTRVSDHLVAAGVATSKVPETMRFYRDTLGFSEAIDRASSGDVDSGMKLRVGGGSEYLEVLAGPADVALFFRFAVPDLEAARARLERTAYFASYGRPLAVEVGRDNRPVIKLWDPEGIRVELVPAGASFGKVASPQYGSQSPQP